MSGLGPDVEVVVLGPSVTLSVATPPRDNPPGQETPDA